ncbi:hypothetical protein E4U50_004043 [Claviceps purpurea]|nr:hypothetical protein E4U50_004043 [Claviceps purpurea]
MAQASHYIASRFKLKSKMQRMSQSLRLESGALQFGSSRATQVPARVRQEVASVTPAVAVDPICLGARVSLGHPIGCSTPLSASSIPPPNHFVMRPPDSARVEACDPSTAAVDDKNVCTE